MLNHPSQVIQIDLDMMNANKIKATVHMTQQEYDLLQQRCPVTLYIITDTGRLYIGDDMIHREEVTRSYLMTNARGSIGEEYEIILNEGQGFQNRLTPIGTFKDAQTALNHMNRLNRVGSHQDWALSTYAVTLVYIERSMSLHDLLIGIISLFGWRDDTRLQELIDAANFYSKSHRSMDSLAIRLVEELPGFRKHSNPLFGFYANLYDLIVVTNDNFIRAKKEIDRVPEPDLTEYVQAVANIVTRV